MHAVSRRSVLLGGAALALAACTDSSPARQNVGMEVIRYGDDPSQFFELTRPTGTSRGTAVVIHGGFWRARYDLSLGRPLAASLVAEGWTAVNLEYRRVGNGGGWTGTFDDVCAGIDALADLDIDTTTLATVGHSAGGHLAVWAAGRSRLSEPAWNQPRAELTAAVSQAGVLDLQSAFDEGLGGTAVADLLTEATPERIAIASPLAQAPLEIPVLCVHAPGDNNVPISQSIAYVDAANQADGQASLAEVDGDHFTVIDPQSLAWRQTLDWLEKL